MTSSSDNKHKKENLPNGGLFHPGEPLNENQRKWKSDKYLKFARELRGIEYKGDGETNFNWCAQNDSQILYKGTRGIWLRITKIGLNTDESPGVCEAWWDFLSLRLPRKTIS